MTMNYYVSGENVNGRPCRGVVHVVKKGDTLYKISRVYDVNKICVPVSSWEMPDADHDNAETLPYIVRAGETLDAILQTFRLTYEELQKLNEDISPAYAEGTVLNIPSNRILRRRQEAQ